MRRARGAVGDYLLPRSEVRLSTAEFAKQHPLGLAARFYLRRARHRARGHRLLMHESIRQDHLGRVAKHNLKSLWRINRGRTERLMNVLRSVSSLDPAEARVLVIGPRNEAELLLLDAHGFRLDRLTAIDLFSASPSIALMDMHDLQFDDDAFDLVYAAYVFAYSDDLARVAAEVRRVCVKGGLVAAAFVVPVDDAQNVVGLKALRGKLDEVFAAFHVDADDVVWREEHPIGTEVACTTIFRLTPR